MYCREILAGLAVAHQEQTFHWTYRPHRFLKSFAESLPGNCRRRPLLDSVPIPTPLFHGMNQRLPQWRARRTVTTFHDLFVMTNEYATAEFRARFTALARHAAEQSDLIIAVSQFTADQVCDLLNVETGRLRVVHHGVHLPLLQEVRREAIILHVGAIQKRKNTARLIESFRQVPEPWRLILAGSAGYGAEEIVRAANGRVEVLGYVNAIQLDSLYRRASIFAFPSLDEGFGIPALEAMAYGVPVVASNVSALPEVCGDAAILVDPTDIDQLAGVLKRLSCDDPLREELKIKGLARAAQFSWANAVNKTWRVYKELLG